MGCVASRIDKEERVRTCKERKALMKQLLGHRKEFAEAQLAYLRSLRNTGATLRQFTESGLLEVEEVTSGTGFPPSPPSPLPPSPPPPPTFSPDLRKFEDKAQEEDPQDEIADINEEGRSSTSTSIRTPPPPVPSSSWEYWDPFNSASVQCVKTCQTVELGDEENWVDTNSDFKEGEGSGLDPDEVNPLQQTTELADDNLSTTSCCTKDSTDMAMVVWGNRKTLGAVVKDMDEYFLKASAVVKDIAVFIDINAGSTFMYHSVKESKRKRSNSAKVFSALTWSWSSKSLQSNKEKGDFSVSTEPCKPGAHCITLQKLHSEEQKLYKNVKEVEFSKVEYGRKSLLLQRQEEEEDWTKAEKTRSTVDSLQAHISSLEESIAESYSTILMLINKELHPQLITLASGLLHMWQTMHNCHQVQNRISEQLSHLGDEKIAEPTTEYHQQAAAQLKTEVASWYHNFCRLVKFQREYVRALSKWTKLTQCLEDIDGVQSNNSSILRASVEKWLQALDNLPDKLVSEVIKGLLSAVHSIVVQQQEEVNTRKKSEKLGRKLEREHGLLTELEMKFAGDEGLTSKHPLSIRRTKVEALKRLVDDEKAKYARCIKTTRTMILNNLKTSLPKVFEALMTFSSAYACSFEAILNNGACEDVESEGNEV